MTKVIAYFRVSTDDRESQASVGRAAPQIATSWPRRTWWQGGELTSTHTKNSVKVGGVGEREWWGGVICYNSILGDTIQTRKLASECDHMVAKRVNAKIVIASRSLVSRRFSFIANILEQVIGPGSPNAPMATDFSCTYSAALAQKNTPANFPNGLRRLLLRPNVGAQFLGCYVVIVP